ncbi:unnamed protein product [Adineta ricciae]|uniref:Apple domain-containing protein n=1 Tax=Adineta ricciae TaxID=249248 RepID=A0A816DI18_ADIRI|nr:unnamed protein product [Adineta ricciae]CAF1637655.1 unnamed protein product [Adineta ricciae]
MPNITCYLILIIGCLVLGVFSGNYTYYNGFAYSSSNQTAPGPTLNACVCQCLLSNGCSALTFYNSSGSCILVSDMNITESEVSLTNGATLLLVNAQLVQ